MKKINLLTGIVALATIGVGFAAWQMGEFEIENQLESNTIEMTFDVEDECNYGLGKLKISESDPSYEFNLKTEATENGARFVKKSENDVQGTNIKLEYDTGDSEHSILVDADIVFTLAYNGEFTSYRNLKMWKAYTDATVAEELGAEAYELVGDKYILTMKLSEFADESLASFVTEDDEITLANTNDFGATFFVTPEGNFKFEDINIESYVELKATKELLKNLTIKAEVKINQVYILVDGEKIALIEEEELEQKKLTNYELQFCTILDPYVTKPLEIICLEGMTWDEFINSEYNIDNLFTLGGTDGDAVFYKDIQVTRDVISNGKRQEINRLKSYPICSATYNLITMTLPF